MHFVTNKMPQNVSLMKNICKLRKYIKKKTDLIICD